MTKSEFQAVIRSLKQQWALSLAQCDNSSGRRGVEMQLEAVEEICDHRINPEVNRLLAGLPGEVKVKPALPRSDAVPGKALVLPVVDDPKQFRARKPGKFKPTHASRLRDATGA